MILIDMCNKQHQHREDEQQKIQKDSFKRKKIVKYKYI
jgi:hypothetical protein